MSDTHLARMVHNQAARYGPKTALRYKSGDHWHDLSYRSLGEFIRTAAKALLELGVRKGEMVGIYSGNRPEWTIADFAILSAGAVSVPIYATSTAGQAGYIVHDADIRIVFAGNQTQYDRITGIPEQSSNPAVVIVFDEGVDLRGNTRGISWRDFLEKGRASARDAELDGRLQRASTDDLATLIYTSGTTGEPKGVVVTHRNLVHSTIARGQYYEGRVGRLLLASSPAFDSSVAGIFWTLCQGGSLVIPAESDQRDPEALASWIAQYRITHVAWVPSLYQTVLREHAVPKLSSLQVVVVGGESLPLELVHRHYRFLPQATLYLDPDSGRGRVLYLRYDGHYGLITGG